MSDSKNIKIIQTIASGGTAVMYKAVQTSLDRIVAVKRLHKHLTDDENFTRRFILEAKAAASLDHPNIVRVIDFGKEEHGYQMVMEFVEGETLKDVLDRWRPIRHDLALAIVHQILLGLEHAHEKGIVHRDIKPGNVMMTKLGEVKIADFGLAKLTQASHSHTADNSILGTPLYMSPEQAFGESVDQRSDLFSLGTVLYELLTGVQPFASDNYMGVIQNIISKELESVRANHSEIPTEVEAIVAKALTRDVDYRFASAHEFREAIEDFLGEDKLRGLLREIPVLLERNTETRVMSAPNIKREKPRRKAPMGGILAALVALSFAGGTVAVALDPDLLERVLEMGATITESISGGGGGRDGIQTAESFDPGTYHFDMSEIVEGEQRPIDTSSTSGPDTSVSLSSSGLGLQSPGAESTRPIELPRIQTTTASVPREEPIKPAPRLGYLNINAKPGAEIYIDGVYKGDTPPQMKLKLRAGRHKIECRYPRYETYEETLKITAGELSRRNVTLRRLMGSISLTTDAGAELYVDGKLYGITPITKPIKLDSGTHLLALKKPGYFTWTSEVTVEATQTLPLKISLSRQY